MKPTQRDQDVILLRQLLGKPGEWLDTRLLAESAEITPALLPFQLAPYQQAGYPVEFHPEQGIRLTEPPDIWCAEEILARCPAPHGGINWDPLLLTQTASTNDSAREQALRGGREGFVVAAAEQTKGRGRMGRVWQSVRGEGLFVSLLLRPGWLAGEAGRLGIITCVAVADAVEAVTARRPSVKWPNDLLLNGKKLSGILIETEMSAGRVNFAVVGVGINVRQPIESFQPELRSKATSLYLETGRLYRRADVLAAFLNALQVRYKQPFAQVREAWEASCLTLGQQVRLVTVKGERFGQPLGLASSGAFLFRTESGLVEEISVGEMDLISPVTQ